MHSRASPRFPDATVQALARWASPDSLQLVIDTLEDAIFVKDLEHRWVAFNEAFCQLLGRPREQVHGLSDPDLFPRDQAEHFWRKDREVWETRAPNVSEEPLTSADGSQRMIWTRKYPIIDRDDRVIGLVGIIADVTALHRRREEVEKLEGELAEKVRIIDAQQSMLSQLSVPIIEVWKSVLLLPIMGAVDDDRGAKMVADLLEAVGRTRSRFVLIDLTGVADTDTGAASALVPAMRAARLLGCESVVVGIRPAMARLLVHLGVDFGATRTEATLHSGLESIIQRL